MMPARLTCCALSSTGRRNSLHNGDKHLLCKFAALHVIDEVVMPPFLQQIAVERALQTHRTPITGNVEEFMNRTSIAILISASMSLSSGAAFAQGHGGPKPKPPSA